MRPTFRHNTFGPTKLFNIPTRIDTSEKRRASKLSSHLKEEGFSATTIIWPEQALTRYLVKLINIPEALQVQEFAEGRVSLVVVRAEAGGPMVGGPVGELNATSLMPALASLPYSDAINVLASPGNTLIEAGDEVTFCRRCSSCTARHHTTQTPG